MKVLVTGGNGFIGSHFIDRILSDFEGAKVVNVDKMTGVAGTWIDAKYGKNDAYTKVVCDINVMEECADLIGLDFDFCVHFAAESHVDNSLNNVDPFIKTNINGTLAVASYCNKRGIPMIHLSTDEVYGHLGSINCTKFRTDDPLEPRNPYAASKASAELMLNAYANTASTFEYYIVRPSNNYGPHQDVTKFLPKLFRSLYSGDIFPMYGSGDFYREWTWVGDTAHAIIKLMGLIPIDNGSVMNVSSNQIMSNFDLAMLVTEKMRKIKNDTVANIAFVKDPRGAAHDKVYMIEDTAGIKYLKLEDGIDAMLNEFFTSDNSAG